MLGLKNSQVPVLSYLILGCPCRSGDDREGVEHSIIAVIAWRALVAEEIRHDTSCLLHPRGDVSHERFGVSIAVSSGKSILLLQGHGGDKFKILAPDRIQCIK